MVKSCLREGCDTLIVGIPSDVRHRKYCSQSCSNIVNNSVRYAATPTVWDNFARRFRKNHKLGTACYICGEEEYSRRKLSHHLDHDHTTGRVRGLLCQGCNLHLGRWEKIKDFFSSGWIDTEFVYKADGPYIDLYRETLDNTDCRCCQKPEFSDRVKRHCVDHNPLTGFIRGILCVTCNGTLGWYENNKEAVDDYLAREPIGSEVFEAGRLACAQ